MGIHTSDIGNVGLGDVANTVVRKASVVPENMPDPGRNLRLVGSALTEWAAAAEKIGDCFGMMKSHRDKELSAKAEAMTERSQYLSNCAEGTAKFDQSILDGYNTRIKNNSFWEKPYSTDADRTNMSKIRIKNGAFDSIPDMLSAPSGFGA